MILQGFKEYQQEVLTEKKYKHTCTNLKLTKDSVKDNHKVFNKVLSVIEQLKAVKHSCSSSCHAKNVKQNKKYLLIIE